MSERGRKLSRAQSGASIGEGEDGEERVDQPALGLALEGLERGRPLAPLTSLELGGEAAYFVAPSSPEAGIEAVEAARGAGLPLTILGGGSNALISDAGIEGLVLQPSWRALEVRPPADSEPAEQVRLRVGAGFDWDQLVLETVRAGWRGIECLSGIPGQVGAAPVQNIGAYGQSLSDCCLAVEVYALDTRRRYWLDAADCDFAYRDSLFKRSPGRFLILSLELALEAGPPHPPRHPQLQAALAEGAEAEAPREALLRVRKAVLALRRSKGMTLDVPSCPDRRSAGSFFMNPVVSAATAEAAARRARAAGRAGEMPRWPEPDGRVKLSAAWLIESAGFPRGYRRGAVGLSTKHTLALTNRGGGRSAELIALAQEIQAGVAARLGVTLSPEPVRLGFSADPFG